MKGDLNNIPSRFLVLRFVLSVKRERRDVDYVLCLSMTLPSHLSHGGSPTTLGLGGGWW